MAQQSDRLERLITAEIGECCEGDVEARVETLREYQSGIPADSGADRTALKTLGD